jgi:hypothetical protein
LLATIIAMTIVSVLVLAELGNRLPAKASLIWWLLVGFLITAAAAPSLFEPLAAFFGFHLVSNFVLAALLFLSFVGLAQHSALVASERSRSRRIVCRLAVRDAVTALGDNAQGVRVLVVVPCYNEQDALPATLARINELPGLPELAVLIVDDGSTDETPSLLRAAPGAASVSHLANVGVAGVLLTGMSVAEALGAEWVVQCDADGQHPIELVPQLAALAQRDGADLLIGSRFSRRHEPGVSPEAPVRALESTSRMRRLGSQLIRAALATFGRAAAASDPTSGFRVYSRRAVRELIAAMPDEYPEPESLAVLACKPGLRITEVQVRMQPRAAGMSSIRGLQAAQFMVKVLGALLGLRLRTLIAQRK